MKIELRKIKHSKALSRETAAYTAEVWVDGKARGHVMNDGGGGPDMITPWALQQEIDAYGATLPPYVSHGMSMPMCAELIFGELLEAHLAAKDLKSALRRSTLFTCADGKLYQTKGQPMGAVKVLNDLPFNEALSLYRSAT